MQFIAKTIVVLGFLGTFRIALMAMCYGTCRESTRNRIVILSFFFPCVVFAGIWMLRKVSETMRVAGWSTVALIPVTLIILQLVPDGIQINEDEEFRIAFSATALPCVTLAGFWLMWIRSRRVGS